MKSFAIVAAVVAAVAAEADPAYLAYGYSGLGYAGLGYALPAVYGKSAPCVNAANIPVPCNHGIWKREAEAEADPAYLALGYSGLGYAGLGYAAGVYAAPHAVAATPFGLTHSSNVGICTNVNGAVVPC